MAPVHMVRTRRPPRPMAAWLSLARTLCIPSIRRILGCELRRNHRRRKVSSLSCAGLSGGRYPRLLQHPDPPSPSPTCGAPSASPACARSVPRDKLGQAENVQDRLSSTTRTMFAHSDRPGAAARASGRIVSWMTAPGFASLCNNRRKECERLKPSSKMRAPRAAARNAQT